MESPKSKKGLKITFALISSVRMDETEEIEHKKPTQMNELKIAVPAPRADKMKTVTVTPERQDKMKNILNDMQSELQKIENIRKKVRDEKISFYTPQQNKQMIEEIKIPSLKMLREKPKKS